MGFNLQKKLIPLLIILLLIVFLYNLFIIKGAIISKTIHNFDQSLTIILWSFLPLETNSITEKIKITSSNPRQNLRIKFEVCNKRKMRIHIKESSFPKGYPINIQIIQNPTIFPWFKKTVKKTILPRIAPLLMNNSHLEIGTLTPIKLFFNTPLKQDGLERYITADFSFKLIPENYIFHNKKFIDYSTWLVVPTSPLKHNTLYNINIDKNTPGLNGLKMDRAQVLPLKTVPPLEICRLRPESGKSFFPLQGKLEAEFSREIKSALFTSDPIPEGDLEIQGNNIIFIPTRLFLPSNHYIINLTVEDYYNEGLDVTWKFSTVSIKNSLWVEVSLWLPQTVRVYRGKKLLREMRASGGKRTTPTPRGIYTIYDRGYAFYSYKFREGAYYWVRFKGPFLFHSVPFGPNRQIKHKEYSKLGTPASHGCIRLPIDDARWFYRNIPNGTQVIIHGPDPSTISKTQGQLDPIIYFRNEKQLEKLRHHNEGGEDNQE